MVQNLFPKFLDVFLVMFKLLCFRIPNYVVAIGLLKFMSFANVLRRVRKALTKLCTSLGLYNRRLSHDEWFDLCADVTPSVIGIMYVILSEYYIYNTMNFF